MRYQLFLLLLIAIIASSLSNIVPVLSMHRLRNPYGEYSQQTDNTESRFHNRNIIHSLICNNALGSIELPKLCRLLYGNYDVFKDETIDKDDNYNGEGFRKEQWHNYPRQLDRLQGYNSNLKRHQSDHYRDGGNDNDNNDEMHPESLLDTDGNFNEILNGNDDTDTPQKSLNKLFILQIPSDDDVTKKEIGNLLSELESNSQSNNEEIREDGDLNPAIKMLKMKRENSAINKETTEIDMSQPRQEDNLTVKKRLFSLWSRLQSLSHKGHELHHRRHLHAFYGMDGGGGGGALTAETRALTLMRPPGSPLRWG